MASVSIKAQSVGKCYEIGAVKGGRSQYKSLRESLMNSLSRIRSWRPGKSEEKRILWALRDLTFEVNQGEVIGIIGRNGAGKSTLLKLLSRITAPSSGYIELTGRVGSLLEVGTGFHPELTGRENIALNASILGMSRLEVKRKFDEIVSFAEVEKFIDTPVKRYSSGMYMRLAFAVAAHLEPEILLVDEVLAVGDSRFQQKCLGKIEDVGRSGRTVFFVSHNMSAVTRLCQRALVLQEGQLVHDGPAVSATRHYLCSGAGSPSFREWTDRKTAPGDESVRLHSVRVHDSHGETGNTFDIRDTVNIEFIYEKLDSESRPIANLQFFNDSGNLLFLSCDFNDREWWRVERRVGTVRALCRIPGNLLPEGRVSVLAAITSYDPIIIHCAEADAVSFDIVDKSEGDGVRGPYVGEWPGLMRPMIPWTVEAPGYRTSVTGS